MLESQTVLDSQLPGPSNGNCSDLRPPAAEACGSFVGFDRPTADIKSIQFGPSTSFGDAFAIDDLRFEADAVDVSCAAAPAVVGCWRFNENALPTAFDSSSFGNDGTYVNAPVLGVPGVFAGDTAVSLDGVNDHVRVPDSASLDVGDSFSLEGWVKRDNTDVSHQLYNKGGQGFQLMVMSRFNGNQLWLRKTNVSTIARTTTGIDADGSYHQFVATKNGPNSTQLYIDGAPQPMQVVSGAQIIQNTAFPLFFSANSPAGGAIAGDIDEFAVYDEALTAAEVADHFSAAGGGGLRSAGSRATADEPGGEPAGAGRCTDIGRKALGVKGVRISGVGCAKAKSVILSGGGDFSTDGYACRVVAEDFTAAPQIGYRCKGPRGARIEYTAVG